MWTKASKAKPPAMIKVEGKCSDGEIREVYVTMGGRWTNAHTLEEVVVIKWRYKPRRRLFQRPFFQCMGKGNLIWGT